MTSGSFAYSLEENKYCDLDILSSYRSYFFLTVWFLKKYLKKYLKYFSNTALILKYFFEIQHLKYFKYFFAQYLLLILKYSLKYLLTTLVIISLVLISETDIIRSQWIASKAKQTAYYRWGTHITCDQRGGQHSPAPYPGACVESSPISATTVERRINEMSAKV